jgi:ketosteroid isomerase-like protein
MKLLYSSLAVMLISCSIYANESLTDQQLTQLANQYYSSWSATQHPNATSQDIDTYLNLLTDDVGHQHLPYDPDDSRNEDGKSSMRKGMQYYLGAHTEYQSELINIMVGYDVIIIKYQTDSRGVHPQTQQEVTFSYETTEVLEVENGKVSVIRKYSE